MSGVETNTTGSEEEEVSRSDPPHVRTALRDPNAQIRLLRLYRGSEKGGISGYLEVWDKGVAPPYRAISYVCGNPDQTQDVTVNGRRVSVRYNSFYALWQTTHHFPWSRVWIDAICINQLDLVEKTAQVKMMYEIYAGATQVLACIGPSDEHSDTVLQATENMDMFVQNLPKDLSWTPRDLNAWNPPLDEAAAAQFLEHYSEFSMRPYFTRVWVVQEVAAGRVNARVLCG